MDTHKHADTQSRNWIQKSLPPVATPAPIYLFSILSLNIVTHFLICSTL